MPSKGPTLVNHGFALRICICIDSQESCLLRPEGACTGVPSFVSLTWVSPGSPSNGASWQKAFSQSLVSKWGAGLINLSPPARIFEKVQGCRHHTTQEDVSCRTINSLVRALSQGVSISLSANEQETHPDGSTGEVMCCAEKTLCHMYLWRGVHQLGLSR